MRKKYLILLFACAFCLLVVTGCSNNERAEALSGKSIFSPSCYGVEQNYCGVQSPDGCYCDEFCEENDDCCADFEQVCPEYIIPEATEEVEGEDLIDLEVDPTTEKPQERFGADSVTVNEFPDGFLEEVDPNEREPSINAVKDLVCDGSQTIRVNDEFRLDGETYKYVGADPVNGKKPTAMFINRTVANSPPEQLSFLNTAGFLGKGGSFNMTTSAADYSFGDRSDANKADWSFSCEGRIQRNLRSECFDSDGGSNEVLQGETLLYRSDGSVTSFTDSCNSASQVIEYFCTNIGGPSISSSVVNCPLATKCSIGACS